MQGWNDPVPKRKCEAGTDIMTLLFPVIELSAVPFFLLVSFCSKDLMGVSMRCWPPLRASKL
jgi:hypothetical protein